MEIQRIAPIRAANVVSVFYFIMFAVFALLMFLVAGWMPAQPNLDPAQQAAFARVMRGFMLA